MRTLKSTSLWSLFLIVCLFITGCGDGYAGTTYKVDGGLGLIEKIEFKSDKKVYITGLGGMKEGTYNVDGDKVSITIGGDNAVFTRHDDGTLEGPLGMKFKKA